MKPSKGEMNHTEKPKKARHTPGPWETGCQLSKVQVNPPGWNQPMFIADCDVAWGPSTEDEKCANAQLIAAAPDLLSSLSLLLRTCQDAHRHGWVKSEREAIQFAAVEAQAAIAKARGL